MGSEDSVYERKIQKVNVDRISNLPDEVLALILSFLPTKCAVGTSILSNRWKFLWTSITSLHFEAPSPLSAYNSDFAKFCNFVDKVIHDCNSPNFQKFSLRCYNDDSFSKVTAWVDEAIKRNIRELDIFTTRFPISIFSCTTLTVLTLSSFINHDDPTISFNLPCLKVLHIMEQSRLHKFVEKLISSCPVLQNLSLAGDISYWKGSAFMVSAPNLKSLKLQLSKDLPGYFTNIIHVNAPNLISLHLSETFIKYDIKGDFSSLVKAYLNIEDSFTTRSGRPFLFKTRAINFTLPMFHNLICLEVTTCDYRFWGMLPKIFRQSPSLEVLTLKQHGNEELPDDEYTWVEPKSVPKCLALKLGVIKIEGFKGKNHELKCIKYCLEKAKVLQKLAINCRGLIQAADMESYAQLCKFPIASKCCQIQFHERFISNM